MSDDGNDESGSTPGPVDPETEPLLDGQQIEKNSTPDSTRGSGSSDQE